MCSALVLVLSCFFFFSSRRRHTRYWRDWSSDVCSSDLRQILSAQRESGGVQFNEIYSPISLAREQHYTLALPFIVRSEERRVGKECRSRRSPDQEKKNNRRWREIVEDVPGREGPEQRNT